MKRIFRPFFFVTTLLIVNAGFAQEPEYFGEKPESVSKEEAVNKQMRGLVPLFTSNSTYEANDTTELHFTYRTDRTGADVFLVFPSDVEVLNCSGKIDKASPTIRKSTDQLVSGDSVYWVHNSNWASSATYYYNIVVTVADKRSVGITNMPVIWEYKSYNKQRDTLLLNPITTGVDAELISVKGVYTFADEETFYPIIYKNLGTKISNGYSLELIIKNETDTVFNHKKNYTDTIYCGQQISLDFPETYTPVNGEIGKYTLEAKLSVNNDINEDNNVFIADPYIIHEAYPNISPETAIDYGVVNVDEVNSTLRGDIDTWYKFTVTEALSDVRISVCGDGRVETFVYENIDKAKANQTISGGAISSGGSYTCASTLKGPGLMPGTYYIRLKPTSTTIKNLFLKISGTPSDLYEITAKVVSNLGNQIMSGYSITMDGQYRNIYTTSADGLCKMYLSPGKHTYSIGYNTSSRYQSRVDVPFNVDASKEMTIVLDTMMYKTLKFVDPEGNPITNHQKGYYMFSLGGWVYPIYSNAGQIRMAFGVGSLKIRASIPGYEQVTTELELSKEVETYNLVFKRPEEVPYLQNAYVDINENMNDSVYLVFNRKVSVTDSLGIQVTSNNENIKVLSAKQTTGNRILLCLEKAIDSNQVATVSYSGGNLMGVDSALVADFTDVTIMQDFEEPEISYNIEEGQAINGNHTFKIQFNESVSIETIDSRDKYPFQELDNYDWYHWVFTLSDTTNGSKVKVDHPYTHSVNDDNTIFTLKPNRVLPNGNYMLVTGRLYDYQNNVFTGDRIGFVVDNSIVIETSKKAVDAAPGQLRVYPNPARDYITVESDIQGYAYLYNVVGRVCKQVFINSNYQQVELNDLPEGLYILKIGEKSQRISISR